MGKWQVLTLGITLDPESKKAKVTSWDDENAFEGINSKLTLPYKFDLDDFLFEAGKQEWELVKSAAEQVTLRRLILV